MAGWAWVYSRSCAPAQDVAARTTHSLIMAPVPKQTAGGSTQKRAQKARPSHHKGVSLFLGCWCFSLVVRSGVRTEQTRRVILGWVCAPPYARVSVQLTMHLASRSCWLCR